MGKRRSVRMRRWIAGAALLGAMAMVAGCSENYTEELHEHPQCIGDAHISPGKADYCMNQSNGHRRDFDSCLAAQGVPDFKIEQINSCVHAEREGY